MDIFTDLNEAKGITIIMVTHEPDIACYARKRIYIRDGQIIREERGQEGCEDRSPRSHDMNILRTSRVAFRALARNKMRSFLTALGIIIGVGAVIAMVSIGEGAKKGVEDRFNSMGTNLLFVSPGSRNRGGVHTGAGGWQSLKAGGRRCHRSSVTP